MPPTLAAKPRAGPSRQLLASRRQLLAHAAQVCLLDDRRSDPQLLCELDEKPARVDDGGQVLEALVLDRLQVRARDLRLGADVDELEPLRLAHLAQEGPGELRLGADLA